ncbi:MAG: HDIG domain-containing protein [Prevotella sp.]|nr:HDIG domain-containing protein [Prevotella sp.]
MSITNHISYKDGNVWHNILTGTLLVLLATFLIVWFTPRREGKQFVYDVGEPWHYGTIIAKYDFPIYKTDEALVHEKDSLIKLFQPYFNYDQHIETENIGRFLSDFASGIPGVPASFKQVIVDRLHRLYHAGIMETPTFNNIYKGDTTKLIRIIYGKNAESILINCIYSTMSAYEQLFNDEALSSERSAIQRLNLNNYIEPNLIYDKNRSETALDDMLSGISPASGMVMTGQKIISEGDMVNEYNFRVVSSLEKEMERRSESQSQFTYMFLGNALYVFTLLLLFTIYLALFRRDYFTKPRSIAMLYSLITIFPVLVSLMMQHTYFGFSVYVLPFAFVPIFIRVFMDSRTAFISHIVMVLLCAYVVRYQFEFIFIQIVAGLVAIYSLREMSSRAQVFKTAVMVCLAMCVSYFTLRLMQSGDEFKLDSNMYYHFFICGVLLLLAYPLMYLVEKAFGFVSNITLIELSNTNRGLLRDLSEVAPGTFQHSITVGNLASEIANKIGANATLVRTGALYHDIGKMINPAFFTENQQGGINPHDNLTDKESAKIIIEHVPNGVKLAEEANLPVAIIDFIRTHHGRNVAKYFYITYQNKHSNEVVDKELFTYPGPNPYTLEQAILMMADGCEAASHSLKLYSEESITALVNKIIDQQVADGCFKECKITFYDIAIAKQVLLDRLKAIYHTRIQYPTSNKPQ